MGLGDPCKLGGNFLGNFGGESYTPLCKTLKLPNSKTPYRSPTARSYTAT